MPLIVDANVAADVFASDAKNDFTPVQRALFRCEAVAVHGGRLTREYVALRALRGILRELDRKGSLWRYADAKVDHTEQVIADEGLCVSDDPHTIALARVSGARLLCSRDQDLHRDFTNGNILRPRGRVYQRPAHRRLIRLYGGRKT